jgi:hypothetical protein
VGGEGGPGDVGTGGLPSSSRHPTRPAKAGTHSTLSPPPLPPISRTTLRTRLSGFDSRLPARSPRLPPLALLFPCTLSVTRNPPSLTCLLPFSLFFLGTLRPRPRVFRSLSRQLRQLLVPCSPRRLPSGTRLSGWHTPLTPSGNSRAGPLRLFEGAAHRSSLQSPSGIVLFAARTGTPHPLAPSHTRPSRRGYPRWSKPSWMSSLPGSDPLRLAPPPILGLFSARLTERPPPLRI